MSLREPNLYIGIVGSRKRDSAEDMTSVENSFTKLLKDRNLDPGAVAIVSGHCPKGADFFAEILISRYNTFGGTDYIYPAPWDDITSLGPRGEKPIIGVTRWGKQYNRKAGYWRNTDIVNRSDIVIACVSLDRTGGTEDTVTKALSAGKTVIFA